MIGSIAVLTLCVVAQEARAPAPPPNNVCGVNSLLMFVRAHGFTGDRDLVDKVTPRNQFGTTLLDLRNASTELGVPAGVYKCDVDDLGTECGLPAIALLNPQGDRPVDHYGLVLSVDPEPDGNVMWIDGTLGTRFVRGKREFAEVWWKHYVLAPKRPLLERVWPWITVGHLLAWGFAFRLFSLHSTSHKSPNSFLSSECTISSP